MQCIIPLAPSVSSNKITAIRSPYVYIRGSATYCAATFYNEITDVRCQYKIELYRAPKNNLNLDGWGINQQILSIVNDVNNNNQVLR